MSTEARGVPSQPTTPRSVGEYDQLKRSNRDTGLTIEILANGILIVKNRITYEEHSQPERRAFTDAGEALEFLSSWLLETFPPELKEG